jgi:hypothetical protein
MEARCPHSFLLSRVKCPRGCVRGPDGRPVRRRRPVKVERERKATKVVCPSTLLGVSRETIFDVLLKAPTLADALSELGTTARHLRKRIENDGRLYALFLKLSDERSERATG